MASRITFIGVPGRGKGAFMKRFCRFAQEHVEAGSTVAVFTAGAEQASALDDLLWTYDEGGFMPHSVLGAATSPLERVVVSVTGTERPSADVIMNFSDEAVAAPVLQAPDADVVVYEFVPPDNPAARQAARRKWERYKEMGIVPSHRTTLEEV